MEQIHISNVARALRFQAGLHLEFGWFCSNSCLSLRIPTPLLSERTSYGILLHSKPSWFLKPLAAYLILPLLLKIHINWSRARKCSFIEYTLGIKGYKIFDIDNVVIVFQEILSFMNSFSHPKMIPLINFMISLVYISLFCPHQYQKFHCSPIIF